MSLSHRRGLVYLFHDWLDGYLHSHSFTGPTNYPEFRISFNPLPGFAKAPRVDIAGQAFAALRLLKHLRFSQFRINGPW